ncbi:hypothetical protein E2320_005681 [Naja naja]|nr:hypothetical protein E2320_005681 [Naja naja]
MAVRAALLLLLALWGCCGPSSSSSSFPHHLVQLSSRRSACKPVPSSMSLCHGVGYSEMRLPNLLGHDTMKEALQQAASWVPLLTKQCHRETKKFLCSLFAPVCISQMEEPVFPCRSLCEAVRDSCLPVMAAFGFPWPEMLNCSRFPGGNELCIPPVGPEDQGQPPREVIPELRGRTLYRQASWSEEERKKPVLWLARWRGLLLRGAGWGRAPWCWPWGTVSATASSSPGSEVETRGEGAEEVLQGGAEAAVLEVATP